MRDQAEHIERVNTWIEQTAGNASPEARVKLFDAALAVLWSHTRTTLGDVTLTAIADRVLFHAAERFPLFAALTVEPTGIQCRALLEHVDGVPGAELTAGIQFVLVELLTVVGN